MVFETESRSGYEHYNVRPFTPRPNFPRNANTCRKCGHELNRVKLCPEHM